jgi:AcrR family transcriptional regulator
VTEESTGRRAEREGEILDAAAKLFRDKGYASTTIRDIGALAGLNHASSHYYFGSKAAILYALYSDALDGYLSAIDAIPDGPPATVLAEIVRVSVHEAARRPDHTAVFFQERRWLEMHWSQERAREVRVRQARFRSRVTDVVAAGIADGSFREIDPGLVVETVVGFATWAYQEPRPSSVDEMAEQAAGLVLGGIRSSRKGRR